MLRSARNRWVSVILCLGVLAFIAALVVAKSSDESATAEATLDAVGDIDPATLSAPANDASIPKMQQEPAAESPASTVAPDDSVTPDSGDAAAPAPTAPAPTAPAPTAPAPTAPAPTDGGSGSPSGPAPAPDEGA